MKHTVEVYIVFNGQAFSGFSTGENLFRDDILAGLNNMVISKDDMVSFTFDDGRVVAGRYKAIDVLTVKNVLNL